MQALTWSLAFCRMRALPGRFFRRRISARRAKAGVAEDAGELCEGHGIGSVDLLHDPGIVGFKELPDCGLRFVVHEGNV